MLKVQLHTHVKGDLVERIPHSPKELIKRAKELDYSALAITTHRKVIFNKELRKFAQKNGIILISGIEIEINKKHIVVLNIDREIENVNTFEKLKQYKSSHPNCLIIAAHPFFPTGVSLKRDLIENIKLFDAIEYSYFYTKTKNYNKEAIALSKRWRLPLVATSDCHITKYLDRAHTFVDSQKDTQSIISAIKKNKIKIHHRPLTHFEAVKILFITSLQTLFKKIKK